MKLYTHRSLALFTADVDIIEKDFILKVTTYRMKNGHLVAGGLFLRLHDL
jgi:hypothetical protein